MSQQADHAAEQAALYLQQMGLRPSTKGYQYLNFALVQLLQGTPFQNTIWELTAIHFSQTQKNVMACVRRELHYTLKEKSSWFTQEGISCEQRPGLDLEIFLRLSVYKINNPDMT